MMKRIVLLMALCLPLALHAQESVGSDGSAGDDDFGLWMEAGVTKKLNRQWSVGADAGVRLADNAGEVSRFSLGASVDYKPLRWMRLSAGYEWIEGHTAGKSKPDYKKDGTWNGYNTKETPSFWRAKHRIKAEVAAQAPKLWRCIRLSARLRYQFTWRNSFSVDRWAYKYYSSDKDGYYDDNLEYVPGHKAGELKPGYPEFDPKEKDYSSTQYLRSRVKVELEKKRCAWSPYISYEFYNDLCYSMTLAKTRLGVGTGYKIDRHNAVSLGYIFSTERDAAGNEHAHIVNVSYEYKF